MAKLIDIHCHLAEAVNKLDFAELDKQSKIIHVSTALNQQEINFHVDNSIKYWFAGIHPWTANMSEVTIAETLKVIPYDKVLGLGEIGIDSNSPDLERQFALLEKQLTMASYLRLVTLYHLVGHEYEFIKLHKKMKLGNMKIIHGFNSSYEVFKELDKLGFYFSLSKRLLNNPKKEKVVRAILASNRFFLESDAPNDGDLDEVKSIAERLETDYNINMNELKAVQAKNFANLLKESCESIPKK